MKSKPSVLRLHLPLLFSLLLILSTTACSDDSVEQPSSATPSTSISEATTTPGITPVPTRQAIAKPVAPQSTPKPTSTATATRIETTKESPTKVAVTAVAPQPLATETTLPEGDGDSRQGGTLNLVNQQVSPHLDVHEEVSSALAAWGPGIVYSRMMRFKSGDGIELPSLAVECELCVGWEMTDGATFEFTLRDDVKWQDLQPVSDRRLVAEDIAYSYERQRSDGMPNGVLLHTVDAIESPSEDEARITLLAPDADFLGSLADGHSKIVAREAVEVSGDLRGGPSIGTGAWVLEGAGEDMTFTFGRNENYFMDGAPMLERLRIHTITDDDTAYAAFRVNNVDVHQLRPEEWDEFRQQKPDASMLPFREIGVGLEVAFKTTVPPFDDVRARRAAMLAMRPNRAIEETWQGTAYLTQGVPLGGADWWLGEEQLEEYFDDQPRATALLAEAVDSFPVPVAIKVGDFGAEYREHAERIADEMRNVGFEPELQVVDRRRFGEEVWLGGDYQMFVGPVAPIGSPNAYMLTVLSSGGAWNTTGHNDEALDALILGQAGEYDAEERRRMVMEVQRIAMEKAYRFMPAAAVSLWAWWPHVKGLEPNFVGSEYSHWERVWIEE